MELEAGEGASGRTANHHKPVRGCDVSEVTTLSRAAPEQRRLVISRTRCTSEGGGYAERVFKVLGSAGGNCEEDLIKLAQRSPE